ncbi:dihydrofolate reductase [Parathielavia appendiculata]|uniref:2,5-diamino-6-ribosylamino-4(3H)-pyrimidinone 5'-phosphate reductase n=1 Tax=Parathielavia appendiculata TaxID=2587402 RepID=A0AAN6TNZ2_9PEZI|nr:dihydrofolate reductase [Parathielavia appendiculata]
MPLLRYNLAPTLNGYIASLPSHSTPWIVEDATIDFPALYDEFSSFVMGRKTYETFLKLAELEPGVNANPLAGRPRESVVVFSRDEGFKREFGGVLTVVDGEEGVEVVRRLKEGSEGGKDIWLMGGGELAGLLMTRGLVDVVEAAIMPVVVTEGVKMFGEGKAGDGDKGEAGWKLVLEKVEQLKTGILMTRYKVLYD